MFAPQAPLLSARFPTYLSKSYMIFKTENVLETLKFAREKCLTDGDSEIDNINEISSMIKNDEIDVQRLLDFLNEQGANPDAADSDGNTAVHYAAILPLLGGPHVGTIAALNELRKFGASLNVKNHAGQSPLQFLLSPGMWNMAAEHNDFHCISMRSLPEVCSILLTNQNISIDESESVFDSIIALIQHGFQLKEEASRKAVLKAQVEILTLFSHKEVACRKAVNKTDDLLNTPLHLWASITLMSREQYTEFITGEKTFEEIMRTVLDHLLKCGAKLNRPNANHQSPLRCCETWTAAKLLLDSGAIPTVLDLSGRSPLMVAFFKNPVFFYPDIGKDFNTFWKSVLQSGLNPWTVDKEQKSLLSAFIESEAFPAARTLLEVACQERDTTNDLKISWLNVICQDRSTHAQWKSNLVDIILNSSKNSHMSLEPPLSLCCKNVVEFCQENNEDSLDPPEKRRKKDKSVKDNGGTEASDQPINETLVHCKIAKQLISFGADIRIRNSSGISCLDIAMGCPFLHDLISKPIDINTVPIFIPWTSISDKFRGVLNKVARRQEYKIVEQILYHRDPISSGSFGDVFAGINEKDGREVAVKRMVKLRMQRPEDKREIKNLTALADCKQVVTYISFLEDGNFSYIILELMEGNLEDFLKKCSFDVAKATLMCKDIVEGLNFLHEQGIVHRDLKPENILYKLHPEMCLKIADFGLSRATSSTSTTVYGSQVGTRCWMAPEVLKATTRDERNIFDPLSDIFSCGLLLHYIFSRQKHPFNLLDCVNKSVPLVINETEANIMSGEKKGWDNSLHPEASHLIKRMLESNVNDRPAAKQARDHPLFWSNKKKIAFLKAVGNQKEIECPRVKRKLPHVTSKLPLTQVESDLDNGFGTVFKHSSWDSLKYKNMPDIYKAMTTTGKGRRSYDTSSAVELVRFVRNVYEHYRENTFGTPVQIEEMLFKNFAFLEYFPGLVMEIYKAVTTHGWDKTRGDIEYAMKTMDL